MDETACEALAFENDAVAETVTDPDIVAAEGNTDDGNADDGKTDEGITDEPATVDAGSVDGATESDPLTFVVSTIVPVI